MKKIKFVQEKSKRKLRVKNKWRSPKGIQNKVKKSMQGHRVKVKIGYGKKKAEQIKLVRSLSDLVGLKETTIIMCKIGAKKKVELIKKALEQKLTIKNIKDANKYLENIEKTKKEKKEKQANIKKRKSEKKSKKEETKKISSEKDAAEEKKELDKLLTKK